MIDWAGLGQSHKPSRHPAVRRAVTGSWAAGMRCAMQNLVIRRPTILFLFPLWTGLFGALAILLLAPRFAAAESKSQTVDVVAVIEPELSMTVQPETGSRIDLGTIHSSATESRRSRPSGSASTSTATWAGRTRSPKNSCSR